MVYSELVDSFVSLFDTYVSVAREVVEWLFSREQTYIGTFSPIEIFFGVGLIAYLTYIVAKWLVPL